MANTTLSPWLRPKRRGSPSSAPTTTAYSSPTRASSTSRTAVKATPEARRERSSRTTTPVRTITPKKRCRRLVYGDDEDNDSSESSSKRVTRRSPSDDDDDSAPLVSPTTPDVATAAAVAAAPDFANDESVLLPGDDDDHENGPKTLAARTTTTRASPPVRVVSTVSDRSSSSSSSSSPSPERGGVVSTPRRSKSRSGGSGSSTPSPSRRRSPGFGGRGSPFGSPAHRATMDAIPPNVRRIYSIVSAKTGSIGGNGSGGAIYGEITSSSMHRMVQLMKDHTGLCDESRFIDVGSGLGKPNLHVAQDPGVEFSFGIELYDVRWMLGMHNLRFVLEEAEKERRRGGAGEDGVAEGTTLGYRCKMALGDITEARYLDPFTHVYMFDIGFPPDLFEKLAEMWNRSKSAYLICYHGPRLIVDRYGFHVELIIQTNTSMHGSSENHMGYIYRRSAGAGGRRMDHDPSDADAEGGSTTGEDDPSAAAAASAPETPCPPGGEGLPDDVPCDPLFADHWRAVRSGIGPLSEMVAVEAEASMNDGRPTRRRRSRRVRYSEEENDDDDDE